MKKAMLFLLLAVPLFGQDYKGVPIPKGISVDYDRLEDTVVFKNKKLTNALWIVIVKNKDSGYYIAGSVGNYASFSSHGTKAIIYIENDNKIEPFTLENWVNAEYDTRIASTSLKFEWLSPRTDEFRDFLEMHIRSNSKIVVRFYGDYTEDLKIKKKDIDRLVEILELKKALQATLKK